MHTVDTNYNNLVEGATTDEAVPAAITDGKVDTVPKAKSAFQLFREDCWSDIRNHVATGWQEKQFESKGARMKRFQATFRMIHYRIM